MSQAPTGFRTRASRIPSRSAAFLALVAVLAGMGIPRAGAQSTPSPAAAFDSIRADSARADSARADSAFADSARAAVARADSGFAAREAGRAAAAALVEARTAPSETTSVSAAGVPVFLGGREVFRVRTSRDGLDPEQRAAAIRRRLNMAVGDERIPADSARIVQTSEGTEVRLGPRFLWMVTPGDVEGTGAADLAVLLSEMPTEVRDGILRERAGRRPIRVLLSVGLALLITLLAFVLARLLLVGARRWRVWLARVVPRFVPGLRIRGFDVVPRQQVASAVRAVLARADLVLGILLLYVYLTAVFSLFPWTQGWSWFLFHFATDRIVELARALFSAVPGLVVIALIFIVFRWLVHLSDRFFEAIEQGQIALAGFHPELARPSRRLVRIVLWVVAAMVAYPYVPGAHTRAVQGVSLLLGVMVSLGSTGFVGNVIAGIVLTYARSFRIGDRVKIGDHVGDVVSLGFFATKLRTIHNEEVTLPNGQVAAGAIMNYSRLAEGAGLVLHTEVTIGYDVPWRKVHALMTEAAAKVEGIEADPAPWVVQRALNDFNVSYVLQAVTHEARDQQRLYSALHQEIQDAFARAGIEILSPSYHGIRDANRVILPKDRDVGFTSGGGAAAGDAGGTANKSGA